MSRCMDGWLGLSCYSRRMVQEFFLRREKMVVKQLTEIITFQGREHSFIFFPLDYAGET